MKQIYLLTGRPGTGKTSLVKEVAARLKGRAGGFYTEEIRTHGVREGFRLVTLDGETATLAHINIRSPYRVSKYGVDIEALKRVGVPALLKATEQCDLVVIDEIGKMELFSSGFREVVNHVMSSTKKVLGTIMLSPHPWADNIKRQPQVNLITLTHVNFQQVQAEILGWLTITEEETR
jgi:nucleoside-triphosphatase